jgi:hypothetical protein
VPEAEKAARSSEVILDARPADELLGRGVGKSAIQSERPDAEPSWPISLEEDEPPPRRRRRTARKRRRRRPIEVEESEARPGWHGSVNAGIIGGALMIGMGFVLLLVSSAISSAIGSRTIFVPVGLLVVGIVTLVKGILDNA